MKTRQKISKALVIALTVFIITSLSAPNPVKTVQASAPASQASSVTAQSSGPRGPEGQPLAEVAEIVMPAVDTQKLLEEASQRAFDEPPRFATALPINLTPDTAGTWETLGDGTQLWRLRITSPDAISLNLGFTAYHMPPGGELYLYTPDYSQVLGPFTAQDNAEHGQLWTPILGGAEVVLEVTLPASEVSQLQLELSSVNHGFMDFETAEKSGTCNVDVVCSQANSWRSQIRSVGRYVYSTGAGSFLCTGALINNTAQNFKPYFLTANHCVSNGSAAATVVVYWNYESSTCRALGSAANGTPISTAGFPTQTGAFLRATYAPSDMTLLELDSPVSASINGFWSGWDRTAANASSAVTIHHPSGHEKRISFENNPTTITSYGGVSVPGNGTHIRITDWDLGTTEGGSSGGPLYNQNARIIGQLHGGAAACTNNSSDWYGRLFTSWTGGGTNATRLSNWLDPGNTGATVLNGITQPTVGDGFEPDNLAAQAKTIALGATQNHNLRPVGDVDWVKFQLNQPSAVILETTGVAGGDTEMSLYNSSVQLIRSSNNEGVDAYSYINTCDLNNLPIGTYYVRVNEFGNNAEISSYKLSLTAGNNCIYTEIAGALAGMFPLYPGASGRQSFIGANNGPLRIFNFDGNPFIAAERVIYRANGAFTSYSELMGLPQGQVGTAYWLPWYDDVSLDTQLRFGNVSNSQATVTVTIGGMPMPSFNLPVGGSDRKNYGVVDGPVLITSNVPIVVAERIIYTVNGVNTSFSEMMGLPAGSLNTTYWLPWYNNVGLSTDLRIGNAGNATANVTVTVADQPVQGGSFQVGVDSAVIKTFANVNNGPVKITSNVPIVVSEGLTYRFNGVNASFAEMMALPNSQLSTTYWLPWYNNVGLDSQLRFGNVSNSQANVQVFIGGTPVQGVTLPVGGSNRLSYAGVNNGPVRIVSNVPIVVAERIIYKVSGVPVSFSELMGLPNALLSTQYWLPWYNNVGLDSQLRFGVP